MTSEIQATYRAADDVLTLMMVASGYATQAHELTSLATFGDDMQEVKRDVLQMRSRLAQRLKALQDLDGDIHGISERLGEHWQRLQPIRGFAYAEAGPYAIGEMLTTVIPSVRRWIRETCGWLTLSDQHPVVLPLKSSLLCNETADGFPLSLEATQKLRDRLLREQSILLKNPDPDPYSAGRMRRRWLDENPDLLEKQFEAIRNKHRERVRDAGGGGRGPWQFKKSLCHEYGLNCPEFSESSP